MDKESEARIGDYLESKIRKDYGDRDHEVEEEQDEVASAAVPASPSASGAMKVDAAVPIAPKTDGGIIRQDKRRKRTGVTKTKTEKNKEAKLKLKSASAFGHREESKTGNSGRERWRRRPSGSKA